jgi:hypothetical protein
MIGRDTRLHADRSPDSVMGYTLMCHPAPTDKGEQMKTTGTTITVERGYKSHSITVTGADWKSIKAGQTLRVRGDEYAFEGETFWDYWSFNELSAGSLVVEYGDDEGGGFDGRLDDASAEEHDSADRPAQVTVTELALADR